MVESRSRVVPYLEISTSRASWNGLTGSVLLFGHFGNHGLRRDQKACGGGRVLQSGPPWWDR